MRTGVIYVYQSASPSLLNIFLLLGTFFAQLPFHFFMHTHSASKILRFALGPTRQFTRSGLLLPLPQIVVNMSERFKIYVFSFLAC